MKISSNFNTLVREAFTYYSTHPNPKEVSKPGNRYLHLLFHLEDKDFDKAISIYKHPRFADKCAVKLLAKAKKDHQDCDLTNPSEVSELFNTHMLGDCIEFVSTIHSACSYAKKASGKTLIRELMNESWYSQKDYQQVTHLQCRFTELCRFWVDQNRVNQDSHHMSEEYSSLLTFKADTAC